MSFSKIGATCLAKVCALKAENKGKINVSEININISEELHNYKNEIKQKICQMLSDKAKENKDRKNASKQYQ